MDAYHTPGTAYVPVLHCKDLDSSGSFEITRINPDGTETRVSSEELLEKANHLYRERGILDGEQPGNIPSNLEEIVN